MASFLQKLGYFSWSSSTKFFFRLKYFVLSKINNDPMVPYLSYMSDKPLLSASSNNFRQVDKYVWILASWRLNGILTYFPTFWPFLLDCFIHLFKLLIADIIIQMRMSIIFNRYCRCIFNSCRIIKSNILVSPRL